MLVAGEVEFFTLMGGLLGAVVPVAEMQGLPFAFRDSAHVCGVMDGPFGEFLSREIEAKGLYALPRRLFVDFFESLGAAPRAINLNQLPAALRAGTVDAQENPLVVVEFNRLWDVQRHVSVTNHMWSGFNLLANLAAWRAIPGDVRAVIERVAIEHAQHQRADIAALNRTRPPDWRRAAWSSTRPIRSRGGAGWGRSTRGGALSSAERRGPCWRRRRARSGRVGARPAAAQGGRRCAYW